MPGVVKVIRDGNFLAVVANKEFQAIKAMHALSAAAKWKETPSLPKQDDLLHVLTSLPSQDHDDLPAEQSVGIGQQDHRSHLYAALSVARLDRAVLRGGAIQPTVR